MEIMKPLAAGEYVMPEVVEFGDWQTLIRDSSTGPNFFWGKCNGEEVTGHQDTCASC